MCNTLSCGFQSNPREGTKTFIDILQKDATELGDVSNRVPARGLKTMESSAWVTIARHTSLPIGSPQGDGCCINSIDSLFPQTASEFIPRLIAQTHKGLKRRDKTHSSTRFNGFGLLGRSFIPGQVRRTIDDDKMLGTIE